jgi:hypothetical protein
MLNPESVMLNLFQHPFRVGLFQHLIKSRAYETLKQIQGDRSGLFTKPSKILVRFELKR